MKNNISSTIQQIKEQADIVSIVGRYVNLQQKGNRFIGLSPFKKENTPSFYVVPDKKFYYCFSTSQGGDIFKFIEKVEHVDFMGAVAIIAREMGISLEKSSDISPGSYQKITRILELCSRIDHTFQYLFWKDDQSHVQDYMKARGFTEETLKQFHIGYAPNNKNWLYDFLMQKGFSKEELLESGLFSKRYEGLTLFINRIMFPILTAAGQVIAYGGRILSGDGPKYINSPETQLFKKKNSLYGIYQCITAGGFKELKKAYLVEGYIDAMALHQAGFTSAVAPLGTAFTLEQAHLIRKYTDKIVIVFDDDEAGIQASYKSALICETVGFKDILVVILSENDPGDILKNRGVADLRSQLLEENEFYDYYIVKKFPGIHASTQEKETLIQELIEYISVIQSPYKQAIYISKTAEILQISTQSIEKILLQIKQRSFNKKSNNAQRTSEDTQEQNEQSSIQAIDYTKHPLQKNGEIIAFATLCGTLTEDISEYENFRNKVKMSDLESVHAKQIYSTLEKLYRQQKLQFENIIQSLDITLSNCIQALIASGEASKFSKQVLQDYYYTIKIKRFKKRSKEIEYQLRTYKNWKTNSEHTSIVEDVTHPLNVATDNNNSIESIQNITKKNYSQDEKIKELLLEKHFINSEITRISKENC